MVIAYIDPAKVPTYMRNSPGFALRNTEICFPLTKHALLVGRWDAKDETINPVNQAFLGVMNNQMIQHSYGLALSSTRHVLYHDPLMRLHWDDKVIARFTTPPKESGIAEFKTAQGIVDGPKAAQHSGPPIAIVRRAEVERLESVEDSTGRPALGPLCPSPARRSCPADLGCPLVERPQWRFPGLRCQCDVQAISEIGRAVAVQLERYFKGTLRLE